MELNLSRDTVDEIQSYLQDNDLGGYFVYTEEGSDPYAEKVSEVSNSWPAAFYIPAQGDAVAFVSHAEAGAVEQAGVFDSVKAWNSYSEFNAYIGKALDSAAGPVVIDSSSGDARTDYLSHSSYEDITGLTSSADFEGADGLWDSVGYIKAREKTITASDATRSTRLDQLAAGVRKAGADALVMLSGIGQAADVITTYTLGRADDERSAVIIKPDGEKVALVSSTDVPNVGTGTFDRVLTYDNAAQFESALDNELDGSGTVLYNPEITQGNYELLERASSGNLRSADGLFFDVRKSKTSEEIAEIRNAVDITKDVVEQVIDTIDVGTTEKEIYDRIMGEWEKRGLDPSFKPLVAIGENAANIHHLIPTDRDAKKGDVILIDLGCQLPSGMCSDITYMVYMGEKPTDDVLAMDEAMDKAIYAAVDELNVGARGYEADRAARGVLKQAGFPDFRHGTGHALGFTVHDLGNGVSGRATKPFEAGEVVTVEPGIYIEGWGGFRKEIDVVITEDGPVMLNEPAKLVCKKV